MRRLATVVAAAAAALWIAAPASAFAADPVGDPHATALVAALVLTLFSLVTVRRLATAHAGPAVAEPATAPAD